MLDAAALAINSRKYPGLCAIVDADQLPRLTPFKWYYDRGYVFRKVNEGRRYIAKVYLHREIMGEANDAQIDHVNRIGLDNRKANLRYCNQAQNNFNQKLRRDNTSGHRGLYWDRRRDCWRVCLNWQGRQVHIGQFKDREVAIQAWRRKAEALYGEFVTS